MKHKPALSALTRLYAELQGELRQARRNEVLIWDEIEHVKAAIRLMDLDFDLASVKPRARQQVNSAVMRGQFFRAAIEVLRQANEPLPTKEIARLIAHGSVPYETFPLKAASGKLRQSARNDEAAHRLVGPHRGDALD